MLQSNEVDDKNLREIAQPCAYVHSSHTFVDIFDFLFKALLKLATSLSDDDFVFLEGSTCKPTIPWLSAVRVY